MALTNSTASSFDPKPFGRYVLIDKLAVGGMAEIYKAKTYGVDGFEKLLAIKRILPHCAADKEFINMLVDEAKLTVLLSHANIVQVYDLGKVADDYFISMEYINGTNLRELMSRYDDLGKKLPEEIAVYISSEMCKGLDYAHRKTDSQGSPLHIVHRDISPQNILISYEGETKIVDFGIAKAAMNVSHTMAGILKGKIAYMSPEQALGKPIDHRTDVFSAGVVLYEMLCGEKLFTGETQFEVLNQIRTTRVNTLMLPEHLSGPLKGIIAKALAYNLKDRYQSAGDFQLDLTKYLYSSYVDFSPRQLASLLERLFQNEMKKREPQVSIDDKTRSVLIKEASRESIVVRSQAAPAKAADTAVPGDTATTGVHAAETERVRKRPFVFLVGTAATILLLLGFFGYTLFLRESKEPSLPPTAVVAEEFGSVEIQTVPEGANILLNGKDTGLTTPTVLQRLPLGDDVEIRLKKDNFKEASRVLTVTTTKPVVLKESLQPLSAPVGSIEIDSNPRGAKIILDGRETNLTTPATIGNLAVEKGYGLQLILPNFNDWSSHVEIKSAEPVKLQAALTPAPALPPAAPPPVVPTPAVPPIGKVKVNSTPAGAKVFVDGQSSGKTTPTTLELPAGKKVTLSLSKQGYKEWSRTLSPKVDEPSSLSASLKAVEAEPKPVEKEPVTASVPETPAPPVEERGGDPASLSVASDPSGAEVYINSEYKGTTPLKLSSLSPGTVKLVITKEGFMRHTSSFRLAPGESKSLGTIALGDQFGELSVQSSPPRATVFLDGEQIGALTPVTIRRVPRDKSHSLRIRLDGYRTWDTTVNLKDSESKKYNVLLEKE